ncbi:MAG TPA: VanW family protein, partial [Polyangiaceae bacterium]
MRHRVVAALSVALSAAVAMPALYLRARRWAAQDLGVLVSAQVPPKRAELRPWLAARARDVERRQATFEGPDASVDLSFAELGIELDVESTARDVEAIAGSTSLVSRALGACYLRPNLADVPLRLRVNTKRAEHALASLAPGLARAPSSARIDLVAHAKIDDLPGRALDVERTLATMTLADGDGLVVPLAMREVPAPVTSAMLAHVDVGQVLSAYETDFSHHAGPRAINIATAARYLNGSLIGPGQVFSFNQAVGARTYARGFVEAPVIVLDELEPGVGGGVCQVASTLHAAAVLGDLEVVQRRSHSRPSGYTPLGLDATVVDGELDLKFKNPYDT